MAFANGGSLEVGFVQGDPTGEFPSNTFATYRRTNGEWTVSRVIGEPAVNMPVISGSSEQPRLTWLSDNNQAAPGAYSQLLNSPGSAALVVPNASQIRAMSGAFGTIWVSETVTPELVPENINVHAEDRGSVRLLWSVPSPFTGRIETASNGNEITIFGPVVQRDAHFPVRNVLLRLNLTCHESRQDPLSGE
jgi:hypothetical protein